MSQPPEYQPQMTEAQMLAHDIARAAERIRNAWNDMLPTQAPGRRIQSAHSTPAGILATHGPADTHDRTGRPAWTADSEDSEADIDTTTRLVSLRRNITTRLNDWCRLIIEDRPVKNPATHPPANDTPAMCRFIERHADWLSGHDAADDARTELTDDARACEAWADPYRKEWHLLGPCPFVYDDGQTAFRFCRGRVRVRVADDTDEATCSDCGKTSTIRWWEEVLGISRNRKLTPSEAAAVLAANLHIDVNERTLRRWAASGRITQETIYGPQPRTPRYWFDERTLIDEAARLDRECVLCGTIHSGNHTLCLRCLSASWRNTPAYAEEKPLVGTGVVATVQRRAVRPTERGIAALTAQLDQWCEFGDLPMAWCGCGRHAS